MLLCQGCPHNKSSVSSYLSTKNLKYHKSDCTQHFSNAHTHTHTCWVNICNWFEPENPSSTRNDKLLAHEVLLQDHLLKVSHGLMGRQMHPLTVVAKFLPSEPMEGGICHSDSASKPTATSHCDKRWSSVDDHQDISCLLVQGLQRLKCGGLSLWNRLTTSDADLTHRNCVCKSGWRISGLSRAACASVTSCVRGDRREDMSWLSWCARFQGNSGGRKQAKAELEQMT